MARDRYKKSLHNEKLLFIELLGTDYVSLDSVSKKLNVSINALLDYIKKWKDPNSGVIVKRKPGKERLYMIEDFNSTYSSPFTEDEFTILLKMLKTSTLLNKTLADKLLKVIYFNTEISLGYEKEISAIKKAIKDRKKISIGKYTGRDKTSNDLELTPIHVDVAKKRLIIYSQSDNKFKSYNIENMEKVAVSKQTADSHPDWTPQAEDYDVFGFSFSKEKIEVELMLTMFAKSQLIRQFPKLEKYLFPLKNDRYKSLLRIVVHDIQPIARFITGLFNEIKIEGSQRAKILIEEYYKNRVENGFKTNYSF